MKFKINTLIITIILTIIVFGISTAMQKKLINYEATVDCLTLKENILEGEEVTKEQFKISKVPLSIIANQKIVTDFKEIEGLYSKDNIRAGQIAIRNQFDTKENLYIYESENGKEKISIKIKNPENAMSFQLKENSYINIYATIRNDVGYNFLKENERQTIGDDMDGYTVIKLLTNIKVLGTFNEDGVEYEKNSSENMDSILIAVTPEEAKTINLIREIATFNITGVKSPETISSVSGEVLTISGDQI